MQEDEQMGPQKPTKVTCIGLMSLLQHPIQVPIVYTSLQVSTPRVEGETPEAEQ
jgi:hypothetical protein